MTTLFNRESIDDYIDSFNIDIRNEVERITEDDADDADLYVQQIVEVGTVDVPVIEREKSTMKPHESSDDDGTTVVLTVPFTGSSDVFNAQPRTPPPGARPVAELHARENGAARNYLVLVHSFVEGADKPTIRAEMGQLVDRIDANLERLREDVSSHNEGLEERVSVLVQERLARLRRLRELRDDLDDGEGV